MTLPTNGGDKTMTNPKEEIKSRIEKYAKWRKEHSFPQFEPPGGICWNCKRQIFEIWDGTEAVTGCPYCHISYCE